MAMMWQEEGMKKLMEGMYEIFFVNFWVIVLCQVFEH